jgi:nucleoside-diphosphate-sugar epimerase
MKVMITGAAGFVGSEFAKYLYRKNIETVLIDNLEYGYKENVCDIPDSHGGGD